MRQTARHFRHLECPTLCERCISQVPCERTGRCGKPGKAGTKSAAHYTLAMGAGKSTVFRLRLGNSVSGKDSFGVRQFEMNSKLQIHAG
ncbi:hypothetical protein [Methanosarcina sp. DH2]|uniref:hypothetical protein n=1 Tax=Methanosarcina sp. DH2 TaxID=2605639 RepID=UPI001E3D0725|nr:hypothetical protein [Methanosarcina sp. DH2]